MSLLTRAAAKRLYARVATTIAATDAPQAQLGPTTRTVRPGSFSVLGFQNNDPAAEDNATRVYIIPRASVVGGVGGDLKLFADNYAADSVNYRDLGWYFSANQATPDFPGGDSGTRGYGVFWVNCKVNGTFAGLNPDIGFSMQDGQYVGGRIALATVNGVTPNIQFVFGPGVPKTGTKTAVVAEFQGAIGLDADADTPIRWARTDGVTVDNALTFQRAASGGGLKLTLGSNQRLLVDNAGSVVLGDGTNRMNVASTTGFFYVRAMAGAPSATPTLIGGTVPLAYDDTNHKLYAYSGGAWKSVTLA